MCNLNGDGQLGAKRQLTDVERKLKLSFGLFQMAYRIKRYQLAQKHPDLDRIALNHLTYRQFETGR